MTSESSVKKPFLILLLVAALMGVGARTVLAGDPVRANGYELRLPDGFDPVSTDGSSASERIRARFGSMPIEGTPDVKAYAAGSSLRPAATLLVGRLDLKNPIRTHQDLGRRQIEAMEARVPAGFEFSSLRVGTYDAIQMQFSSEIDGDAHTSRVLSVACGDYIVVMMLVTADERYGGAEATWDDLMTSLEIKSRRPDLLVVGLIGLGALLLFGLLLRIARVGATADRQPGAPRSSHLSELNVPRGRGSRYAEGPGATSTSEVRGPRQAAPAREGLLNTLPKDGR